MTNHLRMLSPYDIINPMQMVSFLWGGDVTSHILIMLDKKQELIKFLILVTLREQLKCFTDSLQSKTFGKKELMYLLLWLLLFEQIKITFYLKLDQK